MLLPQELLVSSPTDSPLDGSQEPTQVSGEEEETLPPD